MALRDCHDATTAPPRNYSLYVYLYELGVRLLKPGGLLCYIVTNK